MAARRIIVEIYYYKALCKTDPQIKTSKIQLLKQNNYRSDNSIFHIILWQKDNVCY